MIAQEIKTNINKIDTRLKEIFEDVNIQEASDKSGFYFDINLHSSYVFENMDWHRAPLHIKIYKENLISENVKWSYQTNTFDESSEWIGRTSHISKIADDINDLVLKKRMNEKYFENLNSEEYMIFESYNDETLTDEYIIEKEIHKIASEYGIKIKDYTKTSKFNDEFMEKKPDTKISFLHEGVIKISDKFKLESEINSLENVDWVIFKDGKFEVGVSY